MKKLHIYTISKKKLKKRTIIITSSILVLYLLVSLYFLNHFFFNTMINGVNVSLKSYDNVCETITRRTKEYQLQVKESDGNTEVIKGQDIGLACNPAFSFSEICNDQKAFGWISSLFKKHNYEETNLFLYNQDYLSGRIDRLNCLNRDITKSRNAGFQYSDGTYLIIKEIYGNEVDKDKLERTVKEYIVKGSTGLDLKESRCYIVPEYTADSEKTIEVKNTLERYISARITYLFGSKKEIMDGGTINRWAHVDDGMEAVISKQSIQNYIKALSSKYDTVGKARSFVTSAGKTIEVEGGLYGWKINRKGEAQALTEHILQGAVIEKEPLYSQKAVSRDENEIGDTYVEISLTRQMLWFYEDGKLVTSGPVVTGNPNRGNPTVTGIYMLNYKQKNTSLVGAGYNVKVSYWMPFFGNIGIHDAGWRNSFGGEIYKRNGTHGCVNAPRYLAKAIFERIEEGIPIIVYKE